MMPSAVMVDRYANRPRVDCRFGRLGHRLSWPTVDAPRRLVSPLRRRWDQDEVAHVLLLEELALRVGDPLERERLRDERPHLAALEVGDEIREHGLVPRRAADQGQVLE